MSFSKLVAFTVAVIENTIEDAPLKPAHDTTPICLKEHPNGFKNNVITKGLAIKVKNNTIIKAFGIMGNILDGYANRPKRKNMYICIMVVKLS